MRTLTLSLLGLFAATAAQAAERQASIVVSELTCPSCPYIAANAVKSIDSVEILQSEYDQAAEKIVFLVRYDDAVTSPEAIAAAPLQYGYPGRVLEDASGS
ncbi:MAG: heavy-metal-associated domain-containing protein [Paracoccus sp. (in: a-proteobacteria)]|uniref:heavy-metal-associated domain-containing protein n=1 Tax=unclassified Paracoccus (in: a-proteobacteria) TaxID=2688777 RepID=UPI0025D83CF9|nr:hypothetical protein [Paracoccus sp. UBA5162]|tara:strand:- start:361 stop:663 length:303 start_codon:yes stop_codon:yes gene_type:complete